MLLLPERTKKERHAMLRRFSIQVRVLFILGSMALFIAGIVYALVQNAATISHLSLEEIQDRMLDGQKEKLKVAVNTLALAAGVAIKDVPDEKDRTQLLRDMIQNIRFEEDSSGYYFIYKGTVSVAHPANPNSVGQDKKDQADPNGVRPVYELYKKSREGGGFVRYVWPKPNMGVQPKLSYAEAIPGTDFWIGSGVYIDNIEAAQKEVGTKISTLVSGEVRNLIVGVLVVFLLLLAVSIAIVRSIVRPIGEATDAARKIAAGDLNVSLDEQGRDEAARLQAALNAMVSTLRNNIKEITAKTREAEDKAEAAAKATEVAEAATKQAERAKAEGMAQAARQLEKIVSRIADASNEISSQSEEIRQGTEIQRDRVQETATAMEEMNATVLEVARNASSAAEKGQQSRDKAREGQEVVQGSVQAVVKTQKQTMELKDNMHQLVTQAQAIGNIMNVITDIADQTNLLALNAAIEAARAGDAGRGFAVVADEVRKLAEKTMGATKEVGDAINAIQAVSQGNMAGVEKTVADLEGVSGLSAQSGELLQQIVLDAELSAEQIRGIATAAEQQSATSEEINRSVDEINRITMETARGISESAEALRTLAEQVGQLEGLIAELKRA